MTDEVYNAVNTEDTIVNVRIETKKEETNKNNTYNNTRKLETRTDRTPRKLEETREISERRSNNSTLRDLIKILILKQLLGNNRPPVRPPRPPYPGGAPGMPPYMMPPFPGNRLGFNGIN